MLSILRELNSLVERYNSEILLQTKPEARQCFRDNKYKLLLALENLKLQYDF